MKNFLKSALFLVMVSIFTMTSCQNDDNQIINESANLKNTSPLTGLLSRVAQDSTSIDNVIDSTSCFSVNLPVTVIVNNQQVTVSDATDYAVVQNILNEFSDDDDQVSFVFPISITFANYSTVAVNSNEQLDDIIDDCGEDEDDADEIDCLSINYPINISYYDAGTQTPSTITITSDAALYNFFDDFDDDDYATINYPIAVTDSNGNQVEINNNSELEAAIEAADALCDDNNDDDDDDIDDDDDDDDDNSPISAEFITSLQSGTWRVTYFFDDSDETTNYLGYNFTFNQNGTILVANANATFSGQWDAYVDDNEATLEMDFSASQLEELSDDWEIIEFSATKIRLKDVSGGNGETDYLTFEKN